MSFIPPHVRRLARRIQAAGEPLVQVWGWPGSGRAAVLEALLEVLHADNGEPAAGLSLADLAGAREVREALEAARAGGVRWLVASACPQERVLEAARWLRPGQRLVFTTEIRYRLPAVLPCAVLPPQELLLTDQEVACLWLQATGGEPDPAAARRLREASDGWYRPLELALEATGGAGLAESGEEALLEVRAVRSFLRHEVLEPLDDEERELLLATSPEGWLDPAAELRRLISARGWWVEGAEGEHPPRLLAAYLTRLQRRRRVSSAREQGPAPPAAEPAGGGPPVFVLGLLGEPVARQRDPDGRERELDWRLKRSFQVLAFLASSPNLQATREELIEAIWPREGERTIDRNFHPTLSHLRRSLEGGRRGELPPPLLFRGGVYRLNPEIVWEIDLLEFKGLIDEGRALAAKGEAERAAEVWKRAWSLYRGPFLLGYYEAWVNTRRETYQRHYLDLLRDLGDLYMRLGLLPDAMDAYRSVLVEDPLQERIHLAVMRIFSRQGRRDLVRRQYDRLCTLLLEELGVEPMPQTTKEYHELMA